MTRQSEGAFSVRGEAFAGDVQLRRRDAMSRRAGTIRVTRRLAEGVRGA